NAFMNGPVDVVWSDGRASLEEPWRAFLAPSAPAQIVHVLLSCYAVTAFAMCGIHAWFLLREREVEFHRRALGLALPLACATGLLMPLSGDFSARHVAAQQPWKLGAMEAHYVTQAHAPLRIGGVPDDATGELAYGLEVPGALSLLVGGSSDAVVRGL